MSKVIFIVSLETDDTEFDALNVKRRRVGLAERSQKDRFEASIADALNIKGVEKIDIREVKS